MGVVIWIIDPENFTTFSNPNDAFLMSSQKQAIMALENYPSPATRLALTDTIENEHIFYRIRTQAANALAKVRMPWQSLLRNMLYLVLCCKYGTML